MNEIKYVTIWIHEAICPGCKRRHPVYQDNFGDYRLKPHYIGRTSAKCFGNHELASGVQKREMTYVEQQAS